MNINTLYKTGVTWRWIRGKHLFLTGLGSGFLFSFWWLCWTSGGCRWLGAWTCTLLLNGNQPAVCLWRRKSGENILSLECRNNSQCYVNCSKQLISVHLKMKSTLTCGTSSGQSWLLHLYCMQWQAKQFLFICTSRHFSVKTDMLNCLCDDKHICHYCTIQCMYWLSHLHKPGFMFCHSRVNVETENTRLIWSMITK